MRENGVNRGKGDGERSTRIDTKKYKNCVCGGGAAGVTHCVLQWWNAQFFRSDCEAETELPERRIYFRPVDVCTGYPPKSSTVYCRKLKMRGEGGGGVKTRGGARAQRA